MKLCTETNGDFLKYYLHLYLVGFHNGGFHYYYYYDIFFSSFTIENGDGWCGKCGDS